MPNIKTEGIFPNDSIRIRALMLWPSDSESDMRRFYYAADYANGFVYEGDPLTIYPWQRNLIQALLEGPSWNELKVDSVKRTKRAIVAGMVFSSMFIMDRRKGFLPKRGAEGASLSKALFIVQQWARNNGTFGDGSAFPVSDKTIKDCWYEYRSVSHLWSAMEMNRAFPFAPQEQIFFPDHFHKFMMAAAYLQKFGVNFQLDNRAKRSPETLLPVASTWLIDTAAFPPRLMLPLDPAVFDGTPFMAYLREYAAHPQ